MGVFINTSEQVARKSCGGYEILLNLHIGLSFLKMREVTYDGMTFVPYITKEQIKKRVGELAREMEHDCKDRVPYFLCVLNGAFIFASDLFRAIEIDAEISFIRLKSYKGTKSSGNVQEVAGLSENLHGRKIIVIEDIIDTGNTIDKLIKIIKERGAEDVKVATLLFKPQSLQKPIKPTYTGFEIPSRYVIGYGLDIDGRARNLRDIYICKN